MALLLAAGKQIMEAYKAAGYTGNTSASAAAVSGRPDVKARVQEVLAQQHQREVKSNERAIERAAIDKDWIVQRGKYIVELGIRGGRPIMGKDGKPTGEFEGKPNLNAAVKALALLAQMGGYLVNRHEVGQPGAFSRLTEEELDNELMLVGEAIGIAPAEIQKAIAGRSE
jgi:hypothetical protein